MSVCRSCDAPIIWATRAGDPDGGRIALDRHEQIGGTYRVENGKAVEIPAGSATLGFKPHECAAVVRGAG